MADPRQRPLPGGRRRPDPVGRRRLHDHRPLPAGGAGVVPDDDRRLARQADTGCPHRCRPTRSTTCATPSRRPWTPTTARSRSTRGTSPTRCCRPGAAPSPAPSLDKDQIPPDLLQHLRYPEDMFKVQRYQFARYHVTDASDFYQANNQWEVPEDPVRTGSSQTPIRMFSRDPETGRPDLVADVELRAAQQDQPGRRRRRRLRRDVAGLREDPGRGAAQRERARARRRPTTT